MPPCGHPFILSNREHIAVSSWDFYRQNESRNTRRKSPEGLYGDYQNRMKAGKRGREEGIQRTKRYCRGGREGGRVGGWVIGLEKGRREPGREALGERRILKVVRQILMYLSLSILPYVVCAFSVLSKKSCVNAFVLFFFPKNFYSPRSYAADSYTHLTLPTKP